MMVGSIKDPDALAESACRAKLISTDMKDMIVVYGYFHNAQAKTRSLLNIVAEKVKSHSTYFHLFLAVLRNFPGLNQLASRLQASYGGFIVIQGREERHNKLYLSQMSGCWVHQW